MDENQGQASNSGDAATPAVRVEAYAGYRAEESPRRFFIGKREVGVVEIIDRWLDPVSSHFKVRGDDGGIYILRQDVPGQTWEVIMFDSGSRDETRLSST